MLEHLGLGIVLTLEDNFTPQVNQAIQSMDRLTGSAEQLEKDLQRSMSNLQNIMLAGFSLNQVGGSIQKAGKSILNVFSNIGKQVVTVGANMDSLKAQLKTVYGSAEEARKQLEWGAEFAVRTPFDVQGTVRAMQMMKSQGLDVTREFKKANGEMKVFLEAMGDLSTRNMTSRGGTQGMSYAVSNLIGGDGGRSLRALFDLGKKDVEPLKQAVNTGDMNKFMEEFIKLAEEKAPNALQNMVGTWEHVINEMSETWEIFLWKVGESGSFDFIKRTLLVVADGIRGLTSDGTIKAFSDVISYLWKPIDMIVRGLVKVVEGVIKFTEQHPYISKIVTTFVAMTGVALTLSGTVMKLTGSFMILATSIVSAYANLHVLNTLGKVRLFTGMNTQINTLVRSMGVFGIVAGIMAIGFKNDIGGMQGKLVDFKQSWDDAKSALDMGLGNGFRKVEFEMGTTLNGMTKRLMRFQTIGTILFKTLFGEVINGELQYTQKELDNMRVLGLLPFAQTLAVIRGLVTEFTGGLVQGLSIAYETAKRFLEFVLIPIKAVFDTITKSGAFKSFSSIFGIKDMDGMKLNEAEKNLAMAGNIGKVVGTLGGAFLGLKVVKTLTPIISKPFNNLLNILTGTKKATDNLKDGIDGVANASIKAEKKGLFSRVKDFGQGIRDKVDKSKYKFTRAIGEKARAPLTFRTGKYPGYSKVFSPTVPEIFRNEGHSPFSMYAKTPKTMLGRMSQAFFGTKYYTPVNGQLQYAGKHGGRFKQSADEAQLRMSYEAKRDADIRKLIGDAGFRKQAYAKAGVDGRAFNNKPLERAKFLTGMAHKDTSMYKYRGKVGDSIVSDTGIPLYKAKQNIVSKALFGQRYYTPEQDAQGRYYERTMTRSGGLLRPKSKDFVIKDEGDVSLRGRANRFLQGAVGMGESLGSKVAGSGLASKLSSSRLGGLGKGVAGFSKLMAGRTLDLGKDISRFSGNVLGQVGSIVKKPFSIINDQRERLGMDRLTLKSQRDASGNIIRQGALRSLGTGIFRRATRAEDGSLIDKGGLLSRATRGVFGRARYDEFGNMTDKGGLFSRAGRGLGKVTRGVGRGLGFIGGGMMRALPWISLGKMGYDAIKGAGGGDFQAGAENLRQKISDFDVDKAFSREGTFAKSIQALYPLIKEIFIKIATEAPNFLSKAWEGIKTMGALAWQFISDNGMDILSSLGQFLSSVLGDAINGIGTKGYELWTWFKDDGLTQIGGLFTWLLEQVPVVLEFLREKGLELWEWITTDGIEKLGLFVGEVFPVLTQIGQSLMDTLSQAWEWITTTGMEKFGELVGNLASWLLTDGIPLIIKSVISFGTWLMTDGLSGLLSKVGELASAIGKGLWNGLVSALDGIGSALWNKIKGGLGNFIKSKVPEPVSGAITRALGIHHKGLWMSPDEHPAIIRKDETVLPPDKSKQLDKLLTSKDFVTPTKPARPSTKPQEIDNSITIEKVEIVVQADKLSRADAREQAKMILEEFKKLEKERSIRQYA